jgi:dihydrofolate reductase
MTDPTSGSASPPRLSLIAAVSKNGVIGRDQTLPWHLPEDLKRFKETTYGAPVIMGRKTFQSIGRLLPGRKNIIITRQRDWIVPHAIVVPDLESALAKAGGDDGAAAHDVFVIGGGEIYRMALPRADRLYITEIDLKVDGDVYFPQWPALATKPIEIDGQTLRFVETKREERPSPDGGKTPTFRFLVFERA